VDYPLWRKVKRPRGEAVWRDLHAHAVAVEITKVEPVP